MGLAFHLQNAKTSCQTAKNLQVNQVVHALQIALQSKGTLPGKMQPNSRPNKKSAANPGIRFENSGNFRQQQSITSFKRFIVQVDINTLLSIAPAWRELPGKNEPGGQQTRYGK
jgi:hypothetical protein